MSNVLKMEWFRFRKSRYVYIILLVLALLFLFGTILDSSNNSSDGRVKTENGHSIELYAEDYNQTYTAQFSNKFEMLVTAFSGNIVAMSILIFAGLFAGAYRKNKFEKNIVGIIGQRSKLVISNFVICAIYCFIIMCVALIVSLLGYYLFYPNFAVMPMGNITNLSRYLISYYVLLTSVATMMSCFVQIVGNQIVAIIIALIYGSGIIYGIIDFATKELGLETFSIQNYVPLGTLYNLSIHNQDGYLGTILMAILFGLGSMIINIVVKNKQDIIT